jgi:hypothetical protein
MGRRKFGPQTGECVAGHDVVDGCAFSRGRA